MKPTDNKQDTEQHRTRDEATDQPAGAADKPQPPREIGGPRGPEPTRYGDWERRGRCIDF